MHLGWGGGAGGIHKESMVSKQVERRQRERPLPFCNALKAPLQIAVRVVPWAGSFTEPEVSV